MERRQQLVLMGEVLGSHDFSEAHRIVEFLSKSHGRISLIAFHGRASRRRFAGALSVFTSLGCLCEFRQDRWLILNVETADSRLGIRKDLQLLQRGHTLVECAKLLSAPAQALPNLHDALAYGLNCLATGSLANAALAYPHMLVAAGLGVKTNVPPLTFNASINLETAVQLEQQAIGCIETHVGFPLRCRQKPIAELTKS